MGKLLISNCREHFAELDHNFQNNGFRSAFINQQKFWSISVYHKRLIDNNNTYTDGNCFSSFVGTLIYKGESGVSASKTLLHDYATMSIKEIRKNCIGSYCFIIFDGKELITFVDETNTYRMYYWNHDEFFIFTNTYYHIQMAVHSEIDQLAFHEFAVAKCIMGSASPIIGIHKLLANEVIHVGQKGNFFTEIVELNDYSVRFNDLDEAINVIAERVSFVNRYRIGTYKKYLHFVTGGLDSRVELALLADPNCMVKTGYWSGSDPITNGTAEDLRIAKELSDIQNRDFTHYIVDEDFSDACSSIESGLAATFGEYSTIYSGNSKWFGIFENLSGIEYINFGYFGENLKPSTELDFTYNDCFSIEDLVRSVYCRSSLNESVFDCPGLIGRIVGEYRRINDRLGYGEPLTKTNAYNLFSFSHFESHGIVNNFINVFAFGFPIFSQKCIVDAIFSMSSEMRNGNTVPVRLIERFDERLLHADFYSHHQKGKYDRNKRAVLDTLESRIKKGVKSAIKNTPVYTGIYINLFRKYIHPTEEKSEEIIAYASENARKLNIVSDGIISLRDVTDWKRLGGASIGDYYSLLILINQLYEMNRNKK